MDPRNGAVLAMASYPTYQPSIYVGHPDPQKLAPVLDPTKAAALNYPGINRAIDAAYPPGSTFKPVTALAAMQEGLVHPFDQILCSPDFKDHGQTFNNWTPLIDQSIDLPTALADVVRHLLLRAGRSGSTTCRRTAATRFRAGRTASASAR